VLLHLLLKQRTPTVQFSTLRFVKSSLQRTAARRKVKRWLLLTCRVLLLLLLIWAVAQPASKLAGDWFGAGGGGVAAVVVDNSYSMLLRPNSTDGGGTLLDRADASVQDLLRGPLAGAQVAVFTSNPSAPDRPEALRPASQLLTEWSPLRPEPSPVPLIDRLAAALGFLDRQTARVKWLIVVTDGQRREFPRSMNELPEGVRVVWLDLHPTDARNAGVLSVSLEPAQPIPGLGTEVVVEVSGRAGDTRAVSLSVQAPDGRPISQVGPSVATFDAGGRAAVRFPIRLPAEPWVVLRATLGGEDVIEWDNARDTLLRIPGRQRVRVVEPLKQVEPSGATVSTEASQARSSTDPLRFVRLALDPSEGALAAWPLDVRAGTGAGDDQALFMQWSSWPDDSTLRQLRDHLTRGGRAMVALHPALGASWSTLTDARRTELLNLLPGEPAPAEGTGVWRVLAPRVGEPLLAGLDPTQLRLADVAVRRFVTFPSILNDVQPVLDISPDARGIGSGEAAESRTVFDARRRGLLYRRAVGAGELYVMTTLPDPRMTNLPTHPVFLPLMVRMALPAAPDSDGATGVARTTTNVELGGALVLQAPPGAPGSGELDLTGPGGQVTRVSAGQGVGTMVYVFNDATFPGLYRWTEPDLAASSGEAPSVTPAALALVNVSLPAGEAEAEYRAVDEVVTPGPEVLVSSSYTELIGRLSDLSEPQPRWPFFVAVVLLLVCVESLVGSVSRGSAVRGGRG